MTCVANLRDIVITDKEQKKDVNIAILTDGNIKKGTWKNIDILSTHWRAKESLEGQGSSCFHGNQSTSSSVPHTREVAPADTWRGMDIFVQKRTILATAKIEPTSFEASCIGPKLGREALAKMDVSVELFVFMAFLET